MKMRITDNFTLDEMCASAKAKKYGVANIPGEEEIANIKLLVQKLLQPIRNITGSKINVSSGFRNQWLNTKVGGKPSSQHLKGKAADISSSIMGARQLFHLIINSELEFDQVILYDDGENNFVHVSYNQGFNRKQILYSKGTEQ